MQKKQILLIDDEPEHLGWVSEFGEANGFEVTIAETLPASLDAIDKGDYALVLVDMNIPHNGALPAEIVRRVPVVERYPGIAAAIHARSKGYPGWAVVAFTVHDDDAIEQELRKIDVPYVLKGRPEALKKVILGALTRRRK